jgi:hypothetical protein
MRKTAAAEWILALFVSRDRASAAIGDLVEARRFSWISLGKIALGVVLRDFRDVPFSLVFLALQAFILQLAWIEVAIYFRMPTGLAMNVYALTATICTGVWLAHRAPGREMSACLSLALLNAAAPAVFPGSGGLAAALQAATTIGALGARKVRLSHA